MVCRLEGIVLFDGLVEVLNGLVVLLEIGECYTELVLDLRIRLGEILEAFDKLGELNRVLGLAGHVHDAGHGVLHPLHVASIVVTFLFIMFSSIGLFFSSIVFSSPILGARIRRRYSPGVWWVFLLIVLGHHQEFWQLYLKEAFSHSVWKEFL